MVKLSLVITLFVAFVALLPRSYGFYWRLKPEVHFYALSGPETVVGDYADYGQYEEQIRSAKLIIIEENNFGCSVKLSKNATEAIKVVAGSDFVIMAPFDTSICSDYQKAYIAQRAGAIGVLFYYNPTSESSNLQFSKEAKLDIPVAALELSDEKFESLLESVNTYPGQTLISIIGKYYQSLPTSQTFYFVVFSFCILTLLSCLWFILSYVRKCRLSAQRRRRRVQAERETRDLVNSLPVKSHKSQLDNSEDMCAVCLDMFHNKDTLRILPCGHEFHKKCIDPWLKLKRNCPMCKEDISKNSRAQLQRTQTNGSISSNNSNTHLLSIDSSSVGSGDNLGVVVEDIEAQREDNGQSIVVDFEGEQQVEVEMEQVATLPSNNE